MDDLEEEECQRPINRRSHKKHHHHDHRFRQYDSRIDGSLVENENLMNNDNGE